MKEEEEKKTDPAPNSHNRKRQPEARRAAAIKKRDPLENLFYNHNSTIAVETDSRNLSAMSYTVAHIIPSFQSNCLAPSFWRGGTCRKSKLTQQLLEADCI